MIARRRVLLNAAHMPLLLDDLFPTEKAASNARERLGDVWARLRDMCGHYRFPSSRVRYQPMGQGHGLSWTVCPTHDLAAHRREIEDKVGGLAHWQPEPFTPGRGEDIPKPFFIEKCPWGCLLATAGSGTMMVCPGSRAPPNG